MRYAIVLLVLVASSPASASVWAPERNQKFVRMITGCGKTALQEAQRQHWINRLNGGTVTPDAVREEVDSIGFCDGRPLR